MICKHKSKRIGESECQDCHYKKRCTELTTYAAHYHDNNWLQNILLYEMLTSDSSHHSCDDCTCVESSQEESHHQSSDSYSSESSGGDCGGGSCGVCD